MKRVLIAFDVDGTLIKTGATGVDDAIPNQRILNLLVILSGFKNVDIVVWSGGGKQWADDIVDLLKIRKFVKATYSKNLRGRDADGRYIFEPDIKPDLAIDDIQACDLGLLNLIVREK